jgi:3-oxoacyl-(acyl-carrier-protein) synthase
VHEAIYSLLMLNRGFLAESANINDLVDEAEGMNILTKRHVSRALATASLVLLPMTLWAYGGVRRRARSIV